MTALLETNNVVFVTGKGGVGKSTVTAALGLAFELEGDKVLIVETDTYSALEEVFEVELKGAEVVETKFGVDLVNLRTADCLTQTLNQFVPGERIARAVTSNRIAAAFFDAAPSVSEFVLLNRIFELSDKEKSGYDKVVVDLPASGHAVTFLSVPKTLDQMMHGVGPVAAHARRIAELIEDREKTGIVAVCIPEEMPVSETIELSAKMEDALGRSLTLVTANMVHHSPVSDNFEELLKETFSAISEDQDPSALMVLDPKPVDRLIAGNELARRWHLRDQLYLKKLHDDLNSPVIECPWRYVSEPFELLEMIAKILRSSMSVV